MTRRAPAKSAWTAPSASLTRPMPSPMTDMQHRSTTHARKRCIIPARVSENVTPSGVRIGSVLAIGLRMLRAGPPKEQHEEDQLHDAESDFQLVGNHRLVILREESLDQSRPHQQAGGAERQRDQV